MKQTIIAAVTVLFVPVAAIAQSNERWGLPDSPTGRAVASVLEMIDRGEADHVRATVRERFEPSFAASVPMERHVALFAELHARLPDPEPAGLARTSEGATLRVRGRDGSAVRLDVTVNAEGRIAGIRVEEAGDGPADGGEGSLEERLDRWEATGDFSGVVHRTREGEPVWTGAYGEANRSDDVPNAVDTRFNVGSLTKAFTGASILLLREEGALSLDDPIGTYLSGFPVEVAESVTIRHLLTHTSGWGHYWENEAFRARLPRLRRVSDYLPFIREIPLEFEPGARRRYSNVGYEVLGAIVEAASGQRYRDFVRERIFVPLGMDDSGFFARDRPIPRRAVGYTRNHPQAEGEWMENTFLLAPVGTPAGGSYSSAADLARFWTALLDGELLDPTGSNMVLGDYREGEGPPDGPNVYGGGGPGIRATVVLVPERGTLDVVLSNVDSPVVEEIARALEAGE